MTSTAPASIETFTGTCPRCDAELYTNYGEPQCLPCGYVDYRAAREDPESSDARPMRLAYRCRYVGLTPALKDRTMSYHYGGPEGVALIPACPWCLTDMTPVSLTGMRKSTRDLRFVCPVDHRITVLGAKGAVEGWR